MKWRHWWIDDLTMLRGWDGRICMELPKPIFHEITDTRCALMCSLKQLRLGDLMHHVNHYLFPTIMCPWGCSEFPHKVELLPMDLVFLRYLGPGVPMVTKGANRTLRLKGARDDYVDVSREVLLLMNRAWRVMPSIAFDDVNGPSVFFSHTQEKYAGWLPLSKTRSITMGGEPLLAGIVKAKSWMLLRLPMMLVTKLPVTAIRFTLTICIRLMKTL
jgi:hypothetical protein